MANLEPIRQLYGALPGGDPARVGAFLDEGFVVEHIALSAKIRRTGETLDTQVVENWRFSNGKVTEMQTFYADAGQVARILNGEMAR